MNRNQCHAIIHSAAVPAGGVVPPRPNLWVSVLDRIVRILTLGKVRVVVPDRRAPIRWDGIIR